MSTQTSLLDSKDVETIFPEILQIQNAELREKCNAVLVEAYCVGGWDRSNALSCPVSMRIKSPKLKSQVDHVHAVTAIALAMYDSLESIYKNDTQLRDLIIVGALLHDAGKMLEFTLRDGVACHADNADLIRHPLSGAILAAKHQLPDEIIHLIANHSFEGEKSKKTLLSTIVNQADAASFAYIAMMDEQLQK